MCCDSFFRDKNQETRLKTLDLGQSLNMIGKYSY